MNTRKLILFIACSLDGYIAKSDGDISWLNIIQQEGSTEDYGYGNIVQQTDTFILGRKTYEKVLTFGMPFPHDSRETFVVTSKPLEDSGNLHFTSLPVADLLQQIRAKEGKHIHLDGGGELIHSFMKENLIDEYIISIIPVLLGEGIRLFKSGNKPEIKLKLADSKHYPSGLVQLHYERILA